MIWGTRSTKKNLALSIPTFFYLLLILNLIKLILKYFSKHFKIHKINNEYLLCFFRQTQEYYAIYTLSLKCIESSGKFTFN